MNEHYSIVEQYYDARFRVQSVLLLDPSNLSQGYGKLYVAPLAGFRAFRAPNFRSSLADIVCEGDDMHLSSSQDNPILQAIASRIKTPMYRQDRVTREGQIRRHGGSEPAVEWGQDFVDEVRERGDYLSLNAELRINPSEWGQTPVKQTGEITASKIAGRNVTGHIIVNLNTKHNREYYSFTKKFS